MSRVIERMGLLLLTTALLASGCGVPQRDNPLDPNSGLDVDFAQLLIGSWSRADAEKNEIYTFKRDSRVELRDYSAPDGGEVDRNAAYPQTLVISYSGTYTLAGNLLRLSFTSVQTNDPNGIPPALPPTDKVVSIVVSRDKLIVEERDGDRDYARI